MDSIKLKELIDQLEHATITAEKYGPFFFALVFMCVIPTGLVFLYRYLFSSTSNSEIKKGLYTDFRIYFHVAVACGVICTVLSTAWWIYASYRYNEQSREAFEGLRSNIAAQETAINNMKKEDALQSYTAIGRIEDNPDPDLQFDNVLFEPQIYFTKSPYGRNSWIFLIISKTPLVDQQINNFMIKRQTAAMTPPDYLNARLRLGPGAGIGMYKIEKADGRISIVPQQQ